MLEILLNLLKIKISGFNHIFILKQIINVKSENYI